MIRTVADSRRFQRYLIDLFGTMQVGAIHGRLLTAWSVAGILGPVLVNYIREDLQAGGASGVGLYAPTMYSDVRLAGYRIDLQPFRSDQSTNAFISTRTTLQHSRNLFILMAEPNESGSNVHPPLYLLAVVGIPLVWGVWTTILKLPALFK